MSETNRWQSAAAHKLLARQAKQQLELGIFATYSTALEAKVECIDSLALPGEDSWAARVLPYKRAELPLVPFWLGRTSTTARLHLGRLNMSEQHLIEPSVAWMASSSLRGIQFEAGLAQDQFDLLIDHIFELDELGLKLTVSSE